MKRNKFLILIISSIMLINVQIYSQNEGNIWYFGNYAGLSFNTDPPTPLTNGQLNTGEGCAAVSDLNGNLLFYTDGIYVYNKMHNVMPNGSGLMGDPSSTQSAIIVPQPGTYNVSLKRFNIYYIFTVDLHKGSNGVRYSIVDMTLDNGLGDITVKNFHLYGTRTTEKICATKHANGCDFWIIGKLRDNNTFHSYILNNNGLQPPVISNTGPSIGSLHGYMKASHNSQLIAIAHCGTGAGIHVYDFDNNTGNISLKFSDVPNIGSSCYYGIEFSPDDNLLYFTALNSSNIYQYNLNVTNNLAFKSSLTLIGTTSNTFNYKLGALQIAKNNKIYVAIEGKTSLGVINNPNIQGVGCNYTDMSQDLAGRTCAIGLPTFPSSYLVPLNHILFNDNRCVLEPVSFSLSDSTFINVQWYFYDINNPTIPYATSNDHHPNIIFDNNGQYIITAVINYPCIIDTILDTISILNPNISINVSSNNICLGDSSDLTVSSDIHGTTFNWSSGLGTNPNVTVSPTATTTYSVTGTTPEGCTGTTEVTVTVHPLPEVIATASPSVICNGETSVLTASGASTYQWNIGQNTDSFTVSPSSTTTYSVTGTDDYNCIDSDTITVRLLPFPIVDLGNDTCVTERPYILDATQTDPVYSYKWSTGQTTSSISIIQSGTYWVSVINSQYNKCEVLDTINIRIIPTPIFSLPPNITMCSHDSINLSVDQPEINLYDFLWSDGNTSANYILDGLAPGIYHIGVKVIGCDTLTDSTIVLVNDCHIEIPNVITPNGDGINEQFYITNIEYYPNSEIKIYNRWGKKIYESENYQGDWDGDNHHEGTYFYIFRLNYGHGKIVEYHGTITIIK